MASPKLNQPICWDNFRGPPEQISLFILTCGMTSLDLERETATLPVILFSIAENASQLAGIGMVRDRFRHGQLICLSKFQPTVPAARLFIPATVAASRQSAAR
jgi:hypothetical protein